MLAQTLVKLTYSLCWLFDINMKRPPQQNILPFLKNYLEASQISECSISGEFTGHGHTLNERAGCSRTEYPL